ncbi:isopentenyl-diphosphate Delta-isomerase [Chitinophaga agrisoli]|uniref:Isopentenyl-diphosphate delta-isomerase n=1 Tax=Chitinophaga agrisoli TaxID=2607653 RepID=A0A5B2VJE4_9BACT|nr:isopentenyl-diphosphate Delta-isomerase [Chitinophaga agrisoli]KAA2239171.1 isopentenyl-diphosphate Delta-isomerase [Chitinophaga agrisoli]
MTSNHIILVNEQDEALATMEKLEAHQKGLLHRAFSVFVVNSANEMLLHQRAFHKYHSGGLWTNACCSHPKPGEEVEEAAHRRLQEEMGFDCPLQKLFTFTYHATFDNGLIEHEYDHVFLGRFDGEVVPDIAEVDEYGFFSLQEIARQIRDTPERFTYWFKVAFPMVVEQLEK